MRYHSPDARLSGGVRAEARGIGGATVTAPRAHPTGTRSESSGTGPRKAIEGQKMLHVIISILLFDLFWWLRR